MDFVYLLKKIDLAKLPHPTFSKKIIAATRRSLFVFLRKQCLLGAGLQTCGEKHFKHLTIHSGENILKCTVENTLQNAQWRKPVGKKHLKHLKIHSGKKSQLDFRK